MATNLHKISKVLRSCQDAARHYGTSSAAVFLRIVRLKLRERFRPKESFLWGLADPRLKAAEIAKFVSRSQLYRLQAYHNPMSLSYLAENKAVFYSYCCGAGISTPELYGVFHPEGGWTSHGAVLANSTEWLDFIAQELPDSFVIKPSKGVYARGLKVLNRSDSGGFVDPKGNPFSAEELLRQMMEDPDYNTFVIQQRLSNHSDLENLSGSPALQTVRAVTMVDDRRRPRVLFACFKVINSDQLSDNFDYGHSGNLLANIDLETGKLVDVCGKAPSGFGLETISEHPKTGIAFDDFTLPHWHATRRLAEEAALKFLPMRTIGWDIAITPEGPAIIEGNVWWDPLHNAHRLMPHYLATHP